MLFSPFQWLRTAARNAIIGGVADAFNELQTAVGDPGKPVTLADLQTRLQLTAPQTDETPEEDETPTTKRAKR